MAADPLLTAAPLAPAAPAGPPPAAPAPADPASFRRLLESLDRLAQEHRQPPPVADAGDLREALRRADDGFTTAMDLRRALEAAFHGRLP